MRRGLPRPGASVGVSLLSTIFAAAVTSYLTAHLAYLACRMAAASAGFLPQQAAREETLPGGYAPIWNGSAWLAGSNHRGSAPKNFHREAAAVPAAAATLQAGSVRQPAAAVWVLDRDERAVALWSGAGVSRTWLYRNPGVRDLITRLRSEPSRTASTQAAQRATAESLRARLDAARQEISRLRAENATLREQAARHLGQQRSHENGSPPR